MDGLARIGWELLELLVFSLCVRHSLWLQFLGGTIEVNEQAPGGKKYSDRNQDARCIRKLCWIFVQGSEGRYETFDGQRDHDDHEES